MSSSSQHATAKRALYIPGLGSNDQSRTGQLVKQYLEGRYEVLVKAWNLTSDPEQVLNDISSYVRQSGTNMVIASSLGAFYALGVLPGSVAKILINPCMRPSVEIPKLGNISDRVVEQFKKLENLTYSNIDAEVRIATFAGFGNDDELFNYQSEFGRLYGYFTEVQGRHHLPPSSLKQVVEYGLQHFDDIQSRLKNEGLVAEQYTSCDLQAIQKNI